MQKVIPEVLTGTGIGFFDLNEKVDAALEGLSGTKFSELKRWLTRTTWIITMSSLRFTNMKPPLPMIQRRIVLK